MSEETEYISIIIPAYNSEQWLARCLDSVITAADANCEIIVVDDGSTDSTPEIARKYEELDPRILVLTHDKREGVAKARHTGVFSSQGDSVVFVDSDDILPADAIADFRRVSEPGVDIVVGNMSVIETDGSSNLIYNGPQQDFTRDEFLEFIMGQGRTYRLVGKKIARHLFDKIEWDTHPMLAGASHRTLLINLASHSTGSMIVAPSIHTYIHVRRPWSLSAMLQLRTEGIARLWQEISALDNIPEDLLMRWGLHLFKTTLLDRGIPFDNDYQPAVELRALMRRHKITDPDLSHTAALLKSRKARLRDARLRLREGKLSSVAPHLSFVMVMHNNFSAVKRTIDSIFATGFRNIEIVVVDDASDSDQSVKMNSLAVLHPRIVLEKSHNMLGLARARLTGLRASTGLSIMMPEAGDHVRTAGILSALNHIDTGADLVFMGTRMPNWGGLVHRTFNPTSVTALREGAEAAFENLISFGSLLEARYSFIVNRYFIMSPDNDFRGYDADLASSTLMMLNLLWLKPGISATSYIGIRRMSGSRSGTLRMLHELYAKGLRVLEFIEKCDLSDAMRRRATGNGVKNEAIHLLARWMSLPVYGPVKVRKMIARMLANSDVQTFYEAAGLPMPDAEDLYIKVRAFYRRHRMSLLGALLTGC